MKSFDPNQSFFELKIVRWTIVIVLTASTLIAATIIMKLNNKTLLLTYEGFNNLLLIFKTPISVAALLIPIIAIYATNHRSSQTKRQMELTNRQIEISQTQVRIATENNSFTNRFKHADEFEKYLKDRLGKKLLFKMPRLLHAKIYPNVIRGDLKMDSTHLRNLEADLQDLIKSARFFPNQDNTLDRVSDFERQVDSYCKKYELEVHDWKPNFIDGARQLPNNLAELFTPLINIAQNIVVAASFDGDECLEKSTKSLSYLNVSHITDSKLNHPLPIALTDIIELD